MVVRASKTLLSIATHVLDFSKIEADKVTLERRPFLLETRVDLSFEMQSIKANAKACPQLQRRRRRPRGSPAR